MKTDLFKSDLGRVQSRSRIRYISDVLQDAHLLNAHVAFDVALMLLQSYKMMIGTILRVLQL